MVRIPKIIRNDDLSSAKATPRKCPNERPSVPVIRFVGFEKECLDLLPGHRLGQLALTEPRLAKPEHGERDEQAGQADDDERPSPAQRFADRAATARPIPRPTNSETCWKANTLPRIPGVAVAEVRRRRRVVDCLPMPMTAHGRERSRRLARSRRAR